MNRETFLNEFAKRTNIDLDTARKIDDLLEKIFIVGKNNKEKAISMLINEMPFTKEEAEKIYEIRCEIMKDGIKDKLMHPFKSQD